MAGEGDILIQSSCGVDYYMTLEGELYGDDGDSSFMVDSLPEGDFCDEALVCSPDDPVEVDVADEAGTCDSETGYVDGDELGEALDLANGDEECSTQNGSLFDGDASGWTAQIQGAAEDVTYNAAGDPLMFTSPDGMQRYYTTEDGQWYVEDDAEGETRMLEGPPEGFAVSDVPPADGECEIQTFESLRDCMNEVLTEQQELQMCLPAMGDLLARIDQACENGEITPAERQALYDMLSGWDDRVAQGDDAGAQEMQMRMMEADDVEELQQALEEEFGVEPGSGEEQYEGVSSDEYYMTAEDEGDGFGEGLGEGEGIEAAAGGEGSEAVEGEFTETVEGDAGDYIWEGDEGTMGTASVTPEGDSVDAEAASFNFGFVGSASVDDAPFGAEDAGSVGTMGLASATTPDIPADQPFVLTLGSADSPSVGFATISADYGPLALTEGSNDFPIVSVNGLTPLIETDSAGSAVDTDFNGTLLPVRTSADGAFLFFAGQDDPVVLAFSNPALLSGVENPIQAEATAEVDATIATGSRSRSSAGRFGGIGLGGGLFAFALGGGEEGDLARDPVILSQVASVTGLSGYAAGSQRALILPGGLIARVFTSSRATPGYTVDGTSSRGNAADHRDSADHQGGGERDEDHSDQQDDSLVAEWAEDSDGDDEDLFGFDAWQQQQMAV